MADRSVSIALRLKVSDFVAGERQARGALTDLDRKLAQSSGFASGFRSSMERALKNLPKAELDVDATPAETKLAEVKAKLETLSAKKIGVDIDAGEALAEMVVLHQELEELQQGASFDVRADITKAIAELYAVEQEVDRLAIGKDINIEVDSAAALAELAAVDAAISHVDGQTANANVDVDISAAMAKLAVLATAMAGISSIPVGATLALGIGAMLGPLTAATAGAGAFAAVAVPGFKKVSEALDEQGKSASSAGGSTKSAGQAAATAAQQALQLEQAERRVSDAKKAAKAAEEDLTRARQDARRAIEDLNLSLKDGILSERDAALAVEEAQQRLNEVMADPKATDLQRRRAQLDYEQAVQRLEDQQVRTKRIQEDTDKANKAGIEGSDQVRAAKDKLAKSELAVADAVKQLKLLHLQQKAAMEQTGGAAGGLATKFSALNKHEKALAKDLKAFQDAMSDWQSALQPEVFPVISKALGLMEKALPLVTPLVQAAAGAFGNLLDDAGKAMESPFWKEFFGDLAEQVGPAIEGFGRAAGSVIEGIAGIVQAFLPFTGDMVGGIEDIAKAFADWGTSLKDSTAFQDFVEFAKNSASGLWDLIQLVIGAFQAIGEKLAPLGEEIAAFWTAVTGDIAEWVEENRPQIEEFVGDVGGFFDELVGMLEEAVGFLKAIWDKWGKDFMDGALVVIDTVVGFISGFFETIKGIFQVATGLLTGDWGKVWDGLKSIVSGATRGIRNVIDEAMRGLLAKWGLDWDSMKARAAKAGSDLIANIKLLPGNMKAIFESAKTWLVNAGKQVLEGLWIGIQSMQASIKAKILALVKNILPDAVEEVLGIKSPSRVFMGIGTQTMAGLDVGLTAGSSQVLQHAKSIANELASAYAAGMVMPGSTARTLPINERSGPATVRRPTAQPGGNPNYYSGVFAAGAAQQGSLAGRLAREAAGVGSRGDTKSSPTIHIENYHEAQGGNARKTAEELNFMGRRF